MVIGLFVCLFVGIQPKKLCSASCVGREVNPLGMVTYGQRHKPRACQRQQYTPRTCQSMVNHSSYSEGDYCPLSLSEGLQARTFTAVKGRRPARISLFHSVKGRRPALSLQWRAEGPHLFDCFTQWRAAGPHFHCSEGLKARTLFHCFTQWFLKTCLFVCLFDCRVSI